MSFRIQRYGVYLLQRERFPADFLFQLSSAEKAEVVAICDHLQKLKFSKFRLMRLLIMGQFRRLLCWPPPKRWRWEFMWCALLCICARLCQVLPALYVAWFGKSKKPVADAQLAAAEGAV